MRMDFHKFKNYLECPRKYKWKSDRKSIPDRNAYYAIAGELVQKFFEMYSNHWKAQGKLFSFEAIRQHMRPYWDNLLAKNYVDWDHPMSKMCEIDLFLDCIETVHQNIEEHAEMYKDTRSEVKLEVKLKSGDVLVGKIDFVSQEDGGESIWDGKNSGTIGKYVDPRQLLFYALLYRFCYGKLPSSLYFWYFRHKKKVPIPFTNRDVDDLWRDVIRVMIAIKDTEEFIPTPSAKACKLCDYLPLCKEGQVDMASRKRGPKKNLLEGVTLTPSETGVCFIDI